MKHNVSGTARSTFVSALIAICAIVGQQAQATLLFYEPFSASLFADNSSLGKMAPNGWTIGNSISSRGSSTVSSSAALSYEGLATEPGSRGVARMANTSESNRNAGKPFDTAITNGTVYCSFLVKAVTLPTANRCVLSLNQSTGSNGFDCPAASVWLDPNGRLLIGKNSSTNAAQATAALGDKTAFVVLKYTFNAGEDDDEVALYLNPKPGSPQPSKPTLATANGADIKRLVALGLPQGRASDTTNGANSGQINLDDIRVGTEWADVTPAAATKKPSEGK